MFALPDSPETSWFYNSVDKKLAVVRTIGNQTGHKTRNVSQVRIKTLLVITNKAR